MPSSRSPSLWAPPRAVRARSRVGRDTESTSVHVQSTLTSQMAGKRGKLTRPGEVADEEKVGAWRCSPAVTPLLRLLQRLALSRHTSIDLAYTQNGRPCVWTALPRLLLAAWLHPELTRCHPRPGAFLPGARFENSSDVSLVVCLWPLAGGGRRGWPALADLA